MKFNVLYIDPPWDYHQKTLQGAAANHYKSLTKEEIWSLDVGGIAEKNCILFLWVTFPCLPEGMETIRRWGFEYKTLGFCWVKRCKKQTDKWFFGLGNWTRSNPEICLLAVKGHPKRISNKVFSVVDTPLEGHSKKPDIVRERIVELVGDLPRAELFAREVHPGWVCVGNEIDGMDIRDAIEQLKGKEVQDGFSGTDGTADEAGGEGI